MAAALRINPDSQQLLRLYLGALPATPLYLAPEPHVLMLANRHRAAAARVVDLGVAPGHAYKRGHVLNGIQLRLITLKHCPPQLMRFTQLGMEAPSALAIGHTRLIAHTRPRRS